MPRRKPPVPSEQPVTLARLEAALDGLAQIMVLLGDDGRKLLPMFERLEREAEAMRSADRAMDKVRERARRAAAENPAGFSRTKRIGTPSEPHE